MEQVPLFLGVRSGCKVLRCQGWTLDWTDKQKDCFLGKKSSARNLQMLFRGGASKSHNCFWKLCYKTCVPQVKTWLIGQFSDSYSKSQTLEKQPGIQIVTVFLHFLCRFREQLVFNRIKDYYEHLRLWTRIISSRLSFLTQIHDHCPDSENIVKILNGYSIFSSRI